MSGQATHMNQVGGSSGFVDTGAATDGLPQHQMQDGVGLGTGIDPQFVILRNNMREKILEYIGRKQTSADWRRRLPELARRLEEVFFRKVPNKNGYYHMMKQPIEPQLKFAIKTLSAQNQQRQQNHQNQQMTRQVASSSGYGTMIPTPGITQQGASGNSRMYYVTDNTGLSSSGAGVVQQNANMGTSLPAIVKPSPQPAPASDPAQGQAQDPAESSRKKKLSEAKKLAEGIKKRREDLKPADSDSSSTRKFKEGQTRDDDQLGEMLAREPPIANPLTEMNSKFDTILEILKEQKLAHGKMQKKIKALGRRQKKILKDQQLIAQMLIDPSAVEILQEQKLAHEKMQKKIKALGRRQKKILKDQQLIAQMLIDPSANKPCLSVFGPGDDSNEHTPISSPLPGKSSSSTSAPPAPTSSQQE